MEKLADELASVQVATLRYQFSYMKNGGGFPDTHCCADSDRRGCSASGSGGCSRIALLAGGKSMGGRMTSQAAAQHPLEGVRGLVFLWFSAAPAEAAWNKNEPTTLRRLRYRCCFCREREMRLRT